MAVCDQVDLLIIQIDKPFPVNSCLVKIYQGVFVYINNNRSHIFTGVGAENVPDKVEYGGSGLLHFYSQIGVGGGCGFQYFLICLNIHSSRT